MNPMLFGGFGGGVALWRRLVCVPADQFPDGFDGVCGRHQRRKGAPNICAFQNIFSPLKSGDSRAAIVLLLQIPGHSTRVTLLCLLALDGV